jgi:hypothetical protein
MFKHGLFLASITEINDIWDISVSTAASPEAGLPKFDSRHGIIFFSPQNADSLWGPPSLTTSVYRRYFPRVKVAVA